MKHPVLDQFRIEPGKPLPRNFWCSVGILFLVTLAFAAMVRALVSIWP